ncbi:hypothetical protein [Streptomyces olivaceus]|uniref:hypothetical protein n=1 Tax=Streptomyces olivaceus TaxID=47716 RepID=UPI001CCE27A6|nr:hypothetical protein [Streptomyces olivaceus]
MGRADRGGVTGGGGQLRDVEEAAVGVGGAVHLRGDAVDAGGGEQGAGQGVLACAVPVQEFRSAVVGPQVLGEFALRDRQRPVQRQDGKEYVGGLRRRRPSPYRRTLRLRAHHGHHRGAEPGAAAEDPGGELPGQRVAALAEGARLAEHQHRGGLRHFVAAPQLVQRGRGGGDVQLLHHHGFAGPGVGQVDQCARHMPDVHGDAALLPRALQRLAQAGAERAGHRGEFEALLLLFLLLAVLPAPPLGLVLPDLAPERVDVPLVGRVPRAAVARVVADPHGGAADADRPAERTGVPHAGGDRGARGPVARHEGAQQALRTDVRAFLLGHRAYRLQQQLEDVPLELGGRAGVVDRLALAHRAFLSVGFIR